MLCAVDLDSGSEATVTELEAGPRRLGLNTRDLLAASEFLNHVVDDGPPPGLDGVYGPSPLQRVIGFMGTIALAAGHVSLTAASGWVAGPHRRR